MRTTSAANSAIRFGTDGVRGPAGTWPLTAEGAQIIGHGVGLWAQRFQTTPVVVVGRDTRESGDWIAQAVEQGLLASGASVLHGGIMPTAAVSCAVVHHKAQAGIMVTASHNPWQDNGLKVLGPDGRKPSDAKEIEAFFANQNTQRPHASPGRTIADPTAPWRAGMPQVDLSGWRILLDCAHGAAAPHAPELLRSLGAHVIERGCQPDGRNINDGVGAMCPPSAELVRETNAHIGICLDGDADRLMLVHPMVGLLDGDDILWMLSRDGSGPVVGTIMTNGGLEAALGTRLVRTSVGDHHVARGMIEHGAQFGAETSGHVLFRTGLPTGDGLFAALSILSLHDGGPDAPIDASGWTRWTQAHKNVKLLGEKRPLATLTSPAAATSAGNRVVVRYSGTEPVVRIMVEGTGTGTASPDAWAERIAEEFSQ